VDYNGTNGNDILDQAQLGLADWSNIFGGAGNDTITGTSTVSIIWGAPTREFQENR